MALRTLAWQASVWPKLTRGQAQLKIFAHAARPQLHYSPLTVCYAYFHSLAQSVRWSKLSAAPIERTMPWDASCSRLSRSKIWVQESSSSADFLTPSESFSSKEDREGSSNESVQAAHQNLLLKLLILAVIVAALYTVSTALHFQSSNTLVGSKFAEAGPHYKLRLLGKDLLIGEQCPGWVYFWLLMAAGFGLFVSEEALNVWVGATLARMLTFNGLWKDLVSSISANGFYIFSTMFWVYWGVCISDMIPFYAGRFAAQTKAGDEIRKKVGVNEKKLKSISQTVQRYGNLIGFVERFSLGVRNPTSFVAGAMGVSPEKFFTGVCLGALITMPLQMGVGFVLRERPMAALAGVAAVVGAWTVIPYAAAGIASIVFIIRNQVAQQHPSTCSKETSD